MLIVNWFERFSQTLNRSGHFYRILLWVVQWALMIVAGLAAFLLRFEGSIPNYFLQYIPLSLFVWIMVKSLVFRLAKLDQGWWRYVSMRDVIRLLAGNALASVVSTIVIYLVAKPGFPRSVFILDFLLCFLATAGVRVAIRMLFDFGVEQGKRSEQNALIYGAGSAGIALVREIRANPRLRYNILGFVDDDESKEDVLIQGIRVLGGGAQLGSIIQKHHPGLVLLALPSISGAAIKGILERCRALSLPVRTIPPLHAIIEGRSLSQQLRDVNMEDLLGRPPVVLENELLQQELEGRTVLVTGAAGSIGSELCRQIAHFRPATLVGFDNAETPLFYVQNELRESHPELNFVPEIGNIQNSHCLDSLFDKHRPDVVYHAAAFKHVPMMENKIIEAIENNVLGTRRVAAAAARYGAKRFVLISTDKAVYPANVMGASKRMAEMVVKAMNAGTSKTCFCAVRFGNVLGSNGSVVPLFQSQIAAGGPVKVTDARMTRYFMTIPEASQLVLQASAMAHDGEIFVLDMGEPVKILDLARNLILLSGLKPDEDVRIEFTGIRPGEKLFEELRMMTESTVDTRHPKIKVFTGASLGLGEVEGLIADLERACAERDAEQVFHHMCGAVPEYAPSPEAKGLYLQGVGAAADHYLEAAS